MSLLDLHYSRPLTCAPSQTHTTRGCECNRILLSLVSDEMLMLRNLMHGRMNFKTSDNWNAAAMQVGCVI